MNAKRIFIKNIFSWILNNWKKGLEKYLKSHKWWRFWFFLTYFFVFLYNILWCLAIPHNDTSLYKKEYKRYKRNEFFLQGISSMKYTPIHNYNKSHQFTRASPHNTESNRRSMPINNKQSIVFNYLTDMPTPVGHFKVNLLACKNVKNRILNSSRKIDIH